MPLLRLLAASLSCVSLLRLARQMAVVAQIQDVAIHVYERERSAVGSFRRIATFGSPENSEEAHVLYGGRVHYDALQIFH